MAYLGVLIKQFNDRGYGFIDSYAVDGDVFLHHSKLQNGTCRDMIVGTKMSFDLAIKSDGKKSAENVRIIETVPHVINRWIPEDACIPWINACFSQYSKPWINPTYLSSLYSKPWINPTYFSAQSSEPWINRTYFSPQCSKPSVGEKQPHSKNTWSQEGSSKEFSSPSRTWTSASYNPKRTSINERGNFQKATREIQRKWIPRPDTNVCAPSN